MNGATISEQDKRTAQVPEQLFEELHDLFPAEGAPMELDVEHHSFALG